jgi:hypothetical protein
MPFNYKAHTSHMIIENIALTIIPISEEAAYFKKKE